MKVLFPEFGLSNIVFLLVCRDKINLVREEEIRATGRTRNRRRKDHQCLLQELEVKDMEEKEKDLMLHPNSQQSLLTLDVD